MLGLVIAACDVSSGDDDAAQPFVFRDLHLSQKDQQGRPLWKITSPETRYDLSRRIAHTGRLRGTLYRDGEPLYRLIAAHAVVINDGELVQLEGPTRLERLDPKQPAVVTAQRVRWYPNQKRMIIDRSPKAIQGSLELTAPLARLFIDEDRLELRDQAVLRRGGRDPLEIKLGAVDWNPTSGDLMATGPVRGRRTLPEGGQQRLTAPSLRGNTGSQIVDLQPPVRLQDPTQDLAIQAKTTRLNLLRQSASSAQAFEAQLGKARLKGGNFEIDATRSTVVVTGGCRLTQPGASLAAQRCRWHWKTGDVNASGGVLLRRQNPDQETRAERLQGRIQQDGFVEFSAPGGRVHSQLRLPSPEASPFSGSPPGDAPTPAFQL